MGDDDCLESEVRFNRMNRYEAVNNTRRTAVSGFR
jgi:hypothetical protein